MDLEPLLWRALVPLEIVWVLGATIYVILQRRSAQATLAWGLTFAFLPALGLLLYFLIGPRRYDKRKRRRARATATVGRATGQDVSAVVDVSPFGAHLIALCEGAVGVAARPRAAAVRVFLDGASKYAALIEAIEAARHHVHLEYYIYESDRIGTRLRDLLIRRARDGVEVRVLVDSVGSSSASGGFWAPLREAGGHVRHFNSPSLFRRMANFRTHRKIAVIDGRVGFTGGMNITDDHTAEFSFERAWRDTHVQLAGPAVRGLAIVFFEDWVYATDEAPDVAAYLPEDCAPEDPLDHSIPLVQVVSSGPDESMDAIHKLFFAAIAGASRRVWLTTPYFVPDEAIFHALTTAALSGADVRVLVPAKGDQPLVAAAGRSYYPELIEAGVRIFEMGKRVLHAKTLVVDSEVGVVGTANIDPRSFRLNFEVVVAGYDARFCGTLADAFEADLESAEEVTMEAIRASPFPRRLLASTARLFSPML